MLAYVFCLIIQLILVSNQQQFNRENKITHPDTRQHVFPLDMISCEGDGMKTIELHSSSTKLILTKQMYLLFNFQVVKFMWTSL